MPAETKTKLTFQAGVLSSIAFVSWSNQGTNSTISSTVYEFTHTNAILSGSQISFTFSVTTPTKTGSYALISLESTYNSLPYESTSSPVMMFVTSPNPNAIIGISQTNKVTSTLSNYTFSLSSTVPHPTSIIVQIEFPSDTDLNNGHSTCSISCNDTSQGSLDSLRFAVTGVPSSTTVTLFSITVTNIYNRRSTGSSGDFTVATFSQDGEKIAIGIGNAVVETPSSIRASFSSSDQYYNSNTNPL